MLTSNLQPNEHRVVVIARPKDDDHRLPIFVLVRLTLPPDHAGRLTNQYYELIVEYTDDLLVEHFLPAIHYGHKLNIIHEQMEADTDLYGLLAVKITPTHHDEAALYNLQIVASAGTELTEAEYDDELNELAVDVELSYD